MHLDADGLSVYPFSMSLAPDILSMLASGMASSGLEFPGDFVTRGPGGGPDSVAGREALSGGAKGAVALPTGMPSVDAILPDGGLPRGAVVELASPRGLGNATTFALAACVSAQALARQRSGNASTSGAWCAFVDPWSTLHAPGVLSAGVDLSRLLVVRPEVDSVARVAVRLAASKVFSVVVVDTARMPGVESSQRDVQLDRLVTVVRRLALSVERADTTVLLLTDANARRSMPLPVALRIEVDRTIVRPVSTVLRLDGLHPDGAPLDGALEGGKPGSSSVAMKGLLRVAKDRRGRVTSTQPVSFARVS